MEAGGGPVSELVRLLATDWPDALFVEMGPGNVLTGLIKRIVPGAQTFACGTAAETAELLTRIGT